MSTYTVENVRAMLEVVSKRFSRILIKSVDTNSVLFAGGTAEYNSTNVRARTAEIAARINKGRQNLSLTVMIGIWDNDWTSERQVGVEVSIAQEAAKVAQAIYPGTVEGFFLSNYDWEYKRTDFVRKTLKVVKRLREISSRLKIRLGTKQYCEDVIKLQNASNPNSKEMFSLVKEILLNCDFVLCSAIDAPYSRYSVVDANTSFNSIEPSILRNRNEVMKIHRNIEVMLYTFWKKKFETMKEIENLQDYWLNVDKFAVRYNYTSWLHGSFDDSRGSWHMAWWKLPRKDFINNASEYVEKISFLRDLNVGIFTNKTSSRGKYFGILVGSMGGLVLIVIVYLLYKKLNSPELLTREEVFKFRQKVLYPNTYEQCSSELIAKFGGLITPYAKVLEIPKDKLEMTSSENIGSGKFSWVFNAYVEDKTGDRKAVALKMAKPNCGTIALRGFLSEIKILNYLGAHPNIHSLYGVYTEEIEKGIVYLITELCHFGSLKQVLRSHQGTRSQICATLYSDMVRWSYEIACGMEYLEEKRVIHADLAARNVLISSNSTAKITDFGLSRRLNKYSIYTKIQKQPLPWRWMSVESLKRLEFSTKSDVWSYGVTLWEIFSLAALPFPSFEWTREFVQDLEDGLRLQKPPYATSDVYEVMETCWSLKKDSRPSFAELKRSMLSMQSYSNNTLSPLHVNSFDCSIGEHLPATATIYDYII